MLGHRIKTARKHARLSQGELGELCGWDQARQSHYEVGRYEPSIAQLELIARHTGASVVVIAGWSDESKLNAPISETKAATKIEKDIMDEVKSLSTENQKGLLSYAMFLSGDQEILKSKRNKSADKQTA